jgi:hypothetical protein
MTRILKSNVAEIAKVLTNLRRHLGILTDDEARLAYVSAASDRVDLERRIREADRRHHTLISHSRNRCSP